MTKVKCVECIKLYSDLTGLLKHFALYHNDKELEAAIKAVKV